MREIKFRAWDEKEKTMIQCNGYWWEENFTGGEDLEVNT